MLIAAAASVGGLASFAKKVRANKAGPAAPGRCRPPLSAPFGVCPLCPRRVLDEPGFLRRHRLSYVRVQLCPLVDGCDAKPTSNGSS